MSATISPIFTPDRNRSKQSLSSSVRHTPTHVAARAQGTDKEPPKLTHVRQPRSTACHAPGISGRCQSAAVWGDPRTLPWNRRRDPDPDLVDPFVVSPRIRSSIIRTSSSILPPPIQADAPTPIAPQSKHATPSSHSSQWAMVGVAWVIRVTGRSPQSLSRLGKSASDQ